MANELFTNIPSKVETLLSDVLEGRIGLPDLQRPFVWADAKVRDLLDSMLKGYPIGYIMLWSSPQEYSNTGHIGKNDKMYSEPDDLVIDGQQRLTALLASLNGVKIKDKDFVERRIKISFNPLTRVFEVWNMNFEKNPEWIADIFAAFEADKKHNVSKFRREFITKCNEGRLKNNLPELTGEQEDLVEENIKDLLDLNNFSLPTLKILNTASEEDVAEIFVRVNSGGQKLTEKNFIETLLAVYDNDVHTQIHNFCAESRIPKDGTSYNSIIDLDPSHLIRMAVGIGFRRARLRYAYKILRGRDLKTKEVTKEKRDENLTIFREALKTVTNLNNWHAFLNLFGAAGYLDSRLLSSENVVVYSYIFYLLGKNDYNVGSVELNKAITKWIFMAAVTGFYTDSTETNVEKLFADLRDVHTADEFLKYLDSIIENQLTEDYFNVNLPNEFNNSSANSPVWFGYVASINVLGTPMLFSTSPLSKFFLMGTNGTKNSIDKHHIFPKNYLEKIGITDDRERNQIANFTYIDYPTNIDISDDAPELYIPRYKQKLGEEKFKLTCEQNALPDGFEKLEYHEFLKQRRILMSQIIKKAYLELCK